MGTGRLYSFGEALRKGSLRQLVLGYVVGAGLFGRGLLRRHWRIEGEGGLMGRYINQDLL